VAKGTGMGSSEGIVTNTVVGPSVAGVPVPNEEIDGGNVGLTPGFINKAAWADANPVVQRHKHKTLRKVRCMN
jgi:hypothetical protein